MTFGDFDVIPQTDGFFRLDGGAMFGVVPKPLWQKRTEPDERNRIRLGLRPLLVRTPKHTVLIDAGIGGKMSPKDAEIYGIDRAVDLQTSLASAGVTPADVDVVIATHLHFDHAGGFTVSKDGGVERNRASYLSENFVPLQAAGVVSFTDGDQEILPGISVHRTGGHTMHHQLVRIESGGRTGVFVADLMPTTAHVDEPWIMAYDLYPMDTLVFKKQFVREAIDREYVIFFEHDPAIPAGIIRERQGRKFVEPVID
jgi:glyoxylase-like metal-dependent hydrolase (beta-lactamase superfamily II)